METTNADQVNINKFRQEVFAEFARIKEESVLANTAHKKTNDTLDKILFALKGDDLGSRGLVQRLATVETQCGENTAALVRETNRVNMKLAYFGGFGTALGSIFGFLAAWWDSKK